jgi:glucan phosphoethanolaminetransferase (alkaline phosphatase superfamily)
MSAEGTWPRTLMRFLYDFLPAAMAPDSDGIDAPDIQSPEWVDAVASLPGSGDIARRARESSEGDAKTAEDKASRLVQILLALLTITLALGSYQLQYALSRSLIWLLTLIPVGLAIVFLALAAFEALQIDRVGKYSMPDGSELAGATLEQVPTLLVAAEVRGYLLAAWTARHKHSDLMQARAWFTRGLAALLVAGLLAGGLRAASGAAFTRHHAKSPTTQAAPARSGRWG